MNVIDLPYITRVLAPQKRADILHRERLVDFLHEQVECRLILISAPAGYGKTTLLVDFVQSMQSAVCWYSMSEADKDPKVFLEYLVASIGQRFPGFGEKTLGLLADVTDVAKDLRSLVGILVNEIHDSIPEYFFVVLDDYHQADDSPLVNEALDMLLSYLPSNCHIILSSRTLPKITLSRLAAQRLVAGLGTSDLRFTVQEIKDFLRTSFKILLPDTIAQELAERSEGWISGIILGTYGLGQGLLDTIIRARNSGGPVFDFMATEVFRQQPPDLQSFLLESSVLRQFNPRRLTDILGLANPGDFVRAIEERNLFVTRKEGSEWFQYHNLFTEFLRSKLKEESPERFVEINTRAGEVCLESGENEDAVQHFVQARQFDRVARLVEASGEELLNRGQLKTVQRWLEVLPAPMLGQNLLLLTLQGRVLSQVSELGKALETFNLAVDGFERSGDRRGLAMALAKRSAVFRWMGSRQEAIADCRKVLEIAEGFDEAEAEAHKGIGIARGMEGKFSEGIPELELSLAIYERLGSTSQIAELNHALGTAYYFKGDLPVARQHYHSSLDLWEKLGNPGAAAEILNSLAIVSFRQGEYDRAMSILKEALQRVRASGHLRVEANILDSFGMVYRDMDRLDEALESYENGLELARRINEVPLITHLLGEIGGIYRLRGETIRAERLIRQAFAQAQRTGGQMETSFGEMFLGLLAYDRASYHQAVSHLTKSCKGLRAAGAQMELARAHYHLANAYLAQGKVAHAEKQMRVVSQIVSQLGGETYFLAEIRRAPRPLQLAAARSNGVDWIDKLARRLELLDKPMAPATEAPKPEMEAPVESGVPVRAHALGMGKVVCGTREITASDWSTQVAKELFFYLISQPRGARREEVMETLWPDLSPARANSNFHVAMYRLRRATFAELIVHQGRRYFVNPNVEIWYDVEEFERCVSQALGCGANSEEAVPHWEKAISLYQGPFLAQFYSDWCESKRRGLQERYHQALVNLARFYSHQGNLVNCITCCEKVLEFDPFAEEVHRQIIKAHDSAGDRPAAIRHYNRLAQMLSEELDAEPAPETIAVYNSLLRPPAPGANKKDKDPRNGSKRE